MEKMKYKYLITLVIFVTIIIYIGAYKYDIADTADTQIVDNIFKQDGSQLIEIKDSVQVTEKAKTDAKSPLDYIYKVGDEKANLFLLSYEDKENKLNIGDTLTLKKGNENISDQLYFMFRETYPNVSIKDMELDSVEEAYQATQLAIWEIAIRTGEVQQYNELSRIDSIREDVGLKNVSSNVFRKAKNLVSFVEKYSSEYNEEIQLNPLLIIDNSNVKDEAISIDNDLIVGPYSYSIQAGILSNVEITIVDNDGKEIMGQVVDANGFEIKDYKEQKKFYIRFPREYEKVKFKIKTDVKRLVPTIYECNNSNYIVNTYINDTMEKELEINLSKK